MSNLNTDEYDKLLEFNSLILKDISNFPVNILNALELIFNYKLTVYSVIGKDTKIYPIELYTQNLDQNMLKIYKTQVYEHDIFCNNIYSRIHKNKRLVFTIKDFIDLEDFPNTVYGKHLYAQNLYYQAIIYTSNLEYPRHAISIFKTFEEGDFTEDELDLLNKIGKIFLSAAHIYKLHIDNKHNFDLIKTFYNSISYSFAIIENSKNIVYYNENFITYAQILTAQVETERVFRDFIKILENYIKTPLENLLHSTTIDLDDYKVLLTPQTMIHIESVKRYIFLTIIERDDDDIEVQKNIDKSKVLANTTELLNRYNLTKRELEILQLMIEGYSNQQIADIQYISIFTVKTHNKNIFKKLNVTSRMEAVAKLKDLI